MKNMLVNLPEFIKSEPREGFVPSEYVRIYILLDPETNEIKYVGKTSQELTMRLKSHLQEQGDTHKCRWIRLLLHPPVIQSVCRIPFEEWEYWERYFIAFYKALGCNLVNDTIGGEYGGVLGPRSEEFRQKRSQIMLANPITAKSVAKVRLKNIGQKRSQETKNNIAYGRTGIAHSEKTKEFLSEISSKPRNFSEELKKKMSFGTELSRKAKKVYQLTLKGELVKIWPSRSSAQKAYQSGNIDMCLKYKQRTTLGFIWLFSTGIPEEIFNFLSEKYSWGEKEIYSYTLDGEFKSTISLSYARKQYGVGIFEAMELPTKSVSMLFWRYYKKDKLDLDKEFQEWKDKTFKSGNEGKHITTYWDDIKTYYNLNNTLDGYTFITAPNDVERKIFTPAKQTGHIKKFQVISRETGELIKEYPSVKEAQEVYGWAIYKKDHPLYIFKK